MTNSSQTKIAFFGECMIELSGDPIHKGFGGDTLNTALYLSRLTASYPVQVFYATGLGDDVLSRELTERWQHEGIATDFIEIFPAKLPGLYMVQTDQAGERSFLYWRDKAAVKSYFSTSSLNKLETAILNKALDYLYLSGISIAILDDESKIRLSTALKQFSDAGGTVVFDNNFRPQLWSAAHAQYWYSQILPFVDIALITEDDDVLVWGEEESVAQRCLRFGCQEIVIKRGCEPCKLIWQQDGEYKLAHVAAESVANVIDTCAAGDSFAAGYLAGRLTGQSCEASAQKGHALAATVIQYPGAIIPNEAMIHLIR
ncbi:sugar kinase [Vibrio sp. Vb2880]|uniref:sugar kinase n=1 Tax=Vibrio TaxID=662 RepID=UPI0011803BAB|nr:MULTISPECIES: sugar kinase [Vibrio]MBO0214149.1 sugar kinase [Vibrio sp. Vb2880]MCG6211260.1 sugar kinase [Vibrio furnissii]TRN26652.1 2-dehydro-3-deoxygluconokinase [Vibrio furnissii]WJG27328.1 sugar kinase [Vibrio furnissii]